MASKDGKFESARSSLRSPTSHNQPDHGHRKSVRFTDYNIKNLENIKQMRL
jgi:hypothetical protein